MDVYIHPSNFCNWLCNIESLEPVGYSKNNREYGRWHLGQDASSLQGMHINANLDGSNNLTAYFWTIGKHVHEKNMQTAHTG